MTRTDKVFALSAMVAAIAPPFESNSSRIDPKTYTDSLRGQVTHREAKSKNLRRDKNRQARKSRQQNRK